MKFEVIVDETRTLTLIVEAEDEFEAREAVRNYVTTSEGIDYMYEMFKDVDPYWEVCETSWECGEDEEPDIRA